MSAFTEAERTYLTSQPLGRLATVGADGHPHVTPTTFTYEAATDSIVISGYALVRSKKFRDARDHPQVAFVVDDLASTQPWVPRGIEVWGRAELSGDGAGSQYGEAAITIRPTRIIGWGLDTHAYRPSARDVT